MLNHYDAALDELLFINPEIGSLARSLGAPTEDSSAPTAYVYYDQEVQSIKFAMNSQWAASLPIDELAGTIAHETLHVVLHHHHEMFDTATYPKAHALMTAHECIANDTLVNMLQLPMPQGVMFGDTYVGEDTAYRTTYYVYHLINNDDADSDDATPSDKGGEPEHDDGTKTGSCIDIDASDAAEASKSAQHAIHAAADDLSLSPEELLENVSSGGGYSPDDTSGPSQYVRDNPARMNWMELLSHINPKVLETGKPKQVRSNWTRPPRRMHSVYPSVVLPSMTPAEDDDAHDRGSTKPVFIPALDVSRSIPTELIPMLKGLISDIPSDLIESYACTWAGSFTSFHEDNDWMIEYSNGTNFSAVREFVQSVQTAHPHIQQPHVLVITDGEFTARTDLITSRWSFMGINAQAVTRLRKQFSGHHVYHVKDFKQ